MAGKKPKYVRALQKHEYTDALATHGRRVANRLVLANMPLRHRTLTDFYECYAPETGLPEIERCVTGMIKRFDPSGWFVHYPDKQRTGKLWAAPEGAKPNEGVGQQHHEPASETTDTPQYDIAAATKARQLAADIAHAARQIVAATSAIDDDAERDRCGNAMLSTLASTLAAKYGHDSSHSIYNRLVDEVNK